MREEALTVRRVSEAVGVSEHAVRENVVQLLGMLPLEERVEVMERLARAKRRGGSSNAVP